MKKDIFNYYIELLLKFFALVYFFVIAIKYLTGYSLLLSVLPFIGAIMFVLSFSQIKKDGLLLVFLYWLLFFFLMSLISGGDNGFRSVYYLAIGFTAFMVGHVFYRYPTFSLRFSFYLLIIFDLFILGSVSLNAGPPIIILNEIFPGSSRNIVGAMAVFLQMFYSASYYYINGKLPQILILVTSIIVFLAFGRASILALVLLLFIHHIFIIRKRPLVSALILIASVTLVGLSIDIANVEEKVVEHSNFQKGVDSPRLDIISEYVSTTTLLTFFSGHPVEDSHTAVLLNGNPHNSFIRAHSYYGFVSIIFILILFCYFSFKVNSANLIFIGFICIYLFRAIFEPIAFFDIFDFLFFYLLFLVSHPRGYTNYAD